MKKILGQGAGGLLCFVVGLSCSSSTTVEGSGGGGGKSGVDGGDSAGGTAGRAGSSNAGTAGSGGGATGGSGGGGTSAGGNGGSSVDASADSATGGSGGAAVCTPGAKDCAGEVPRVCSDTGQWTSLTPCAAPSSKCDTGACVPQNCVGLAATCGVNSDRSCCETAAVPGAPFPMGRGTGPDAFASGQPDEQPEHTATPLPFNLDVFEVTVGRFRRFLAGYPGNRPAAGAGAHAGIVNSGWQTAWNAELADDSYFFGIDLKCSNRATWTDQAGSGENRPINCLSYYAAFAFCAWDGGFLPTEAEWELAAAGGSDNRLYPWGSQAPDKTRTAVDCSYGANYPTCEFDDIPFVGKLPMGAARYGHLDMAGSMYEWTLDAYNATYYGGAGQTCNNCANLSGTMRVRRGGSWLSNLEEVRAVRRSAVAPADRDEDSGVRCARL